MHPTSFDPSELAVEMRIQAEVAQVEALPIEVEAVEEVLFYDWAKQDSDLKL